MYGRNVELMINEAVGCETLEEAKGAIRDYTKDRICAFLEGLYGYELFEFVHDVLNDCVHEMSQLDEVYRHLTVTEVLENLMEIDLCDDYFNEDTCTSGNDIWELADVSLNEAVRQIYNRDVYWEYDDLDTILDEEELAVGIVTEKFKMYDKAKELFDKAMSTDPRAVVNVLWNMNQE